MDLQTEKLAEIAGRIEPDLKRFDDLVTVATQRVSARSPQAAPGLLARVLARLRLGPKTHRPPSKAEDPRFHEVQRHLELLEKARTALVRDVVYQTANADEWEKRAKLAVQAGDDDLAWEALGRSREALDLAAKLERQAGTISAALAEYTSAVAALKAS